MLRPVSLIELPPPVDLGAPAHFSQWRRAQVQAVLRHLHSDKRFCASDMPTGTGKSLMYVMLHVMGGGRTCVLTSTKGLQDQLLNDFRELGMVDVRGANSYGCVALAHGEFGDPVSDSCDAGPCRLGVPCSKRESGCLYYDALARARGADLVVTNYAFWLLQQNRAKGIGAFDRLVLDEAHDAMDWLASFLSGEVFLHELSLVGSTLPRPEFTPKDIQKWARAVALRVEERKVRLKEQITEDRAFGGSSREMRKEVRALDMLAGKLGLLGSEYGEHWIGEFKPYSFRYNVVWPASYADEYLFKGIAHVDLVSATIRPKSCGMLGIQPRDLDFQDYPSEFPANRRLVIHVPTVRMNHRNDAGDEKAWLSRLDQIVGARLDRKGIIHTVSYKRRDLVMAHSQHREVMVSHTPQTARSVIERFKAAPAPSVLVSPSVTTGWDFPYEECEYQIVLKIPFPDMSDPVMQARRKDDKDYAAFVAAQTLVQMVGRGMRAPDDRCETLVLDDNVRWFLHQYRNFFPRWFLGACTSVTGLPKVPLKIGGG